MHAELVDQAQRGDREAFDSLARLTGDRCMAIAFRILRDFDLADDAVQAALLTAWREIRSLRDPARFEPWLHRILTNACYAEARRRRRWSEGIRLLSVEPVHGPRRVPDRRRSRPARTRLPAAHRRAARRPGLSPLPRASAARGGGALGIPLGTVKSRMHHAKRALRASLEADARASSDPRSEWHDRAPTTSTGSSTPSSRRARPSCPTRRSTRSAIAWNTKRQRVVIGPWRIPDMNKFVAHRPGRRRRGRGRSSSAIQVFGSAGNGGVGRRPIATPEPTASPATVAPSSPPASPPPLTQTFTSTQHGISCRTPRDGPLRRRPSPGRIARSPKLLCSRRRRPVRPDP